MKPPRSSAYLRFIRSLPCAVCDSTTGVEAHHVGLHGMSVKSSDFSTIPLCRKHHRYFHELGPKRFAERYGLDIPAIVQRLNAKPRMTIESGFYIARFDDRHEYIVGSTRINLETALKRVQALWWADRKTA